MKWTAERGIAQRTTYIRSSNASAIPAGSVLATPTTISLFFLASSLTVSFSLSLSLSLNLSQSLSISLSPISLFVENGDRNRIIQLSVSSSCFEGSLDYGCQSAPPPVPDKPVPRNSSFFNRKSVSGQVSPNLSSLLSVAISEEQNPNLNIYLFIYWITL